MSDAVFPPNFPVIQRPANSLSTAPIPAARERRRDPWTRAGRSHVAAFGLCLGLAILFTLPGSVSPKTALLGDPGDNYQHAWFLWHFTRAVVHGENPFFTDLIFYPHRVNLAWSTTDPLAAVLALPLSLILGPVASYNLSVVLQLALAAFFARWLCLDICRNEIAAMIGGVCFGFCPFLLAHALGHLSLVTAFPIPLFWLALDRVLKGRSTSLKAGLFLGFALWLSVLAHYDYTVLPAAGTDRGRQRTLLGGLGLTRESLETVCLRLGRISASCESGVGDAARECGRDASSPADRSRTPIFSGPCRSADSQLEPYVSRALVP